MIVFATVLGCPVSGRSRHSVSNRIENEGGSSTKPTGDKTGETTSPDGKTCQAYTQDTSEQSKSIRIAAGASHSLWIDDEGTLYGWGGNSGGQLGLGSTIMIETPQEISISEVHSRVTGEDAKKYNKSPWIGVAAGPYYTIAWKEDGSAWSWGDGKQNKLGLDDTNLLAPDDSSIVRYPRKITYSTGKISKIVIGVNHSLAINDNGNFYGWGDNSEKQLVTSTHFNNSNAARFHSISVFQKIMDIAAGRGHSLIIGVDGKVYAAGSNTEYQLAKNAITSSSSLLEIMCDVKKIAAGDNTSFAIDKNGKLWGWGSNNLGQLAQNPKPKLTKTSTPQQIIVTGVTKWKEVVASSSYALGIDEEARLWIWGNNGYVTSNTNQNYTPQQIGEEQKWSAIAVGTSHILALDSTGALWGLGTNTSRQLSNQVPQETEPGKLYKILPVQNSP